MVVRCSATAPLWGVRFCQSADIGSRQYACRGKGARSCLVELAWAGAYPGGSTPPDPCQTAAGCCSMGLLLAGLCAADRDAVEGFPWPGRPRGWTQLGGRSPGLPLAAAVLPAGRRRTVRCARSCVKARLLPLLRRSSRAALRCAALTPALSAWATRRSRKNKTCSAQPLNGQGSVAHLLAHPLFGGHGKPSHPCVSLQHTALRKNLQAKSVAQFIAVCRRSKWSKHVTNSPFLALRAMAGSSAACKISSACSKALY